MLCRSSRAENLVSSDPRVASRRPTAPRPASRLSKADAVLGKGGEGPREGMRMAWQARGQNIGSRCQTMPTVLGTRLRPFSRDRIDRTERSNRPATPQQALG
jgi:hypothetical protein